MVVETFGAWSKESTEIIDLIARKDAQRNEAPLSSRKNYIYQKLSITLQRCNAIRILAQMRPFQKYINNTTQEENEFHDNSISEEQTAFEINQNNINQSSSNSIKKVIENNSPQKYNEIKKLPKRLIDKFNKRDVTNKTPFKYNNHNNQPIENKNIKKSKIKKNIKLNQPQLRVTLRSNNKNVFNLKGDVVDQIRKKFPDVPKIDLLQFYEIRL